MGSKFMWAARRRCKSFALNLSGANKFSIFSSFSSSFSGFFPEKGRGWVRGKQKDFAAKANGFLVSCYYFIWPEPCDSDNCNFSRAIATDRAGSPGNERNAPKGLGLGLEQGRIGAGPVGGA